MASRGKVSLTLLSILVTIIGLGGFQDDIKVWMGWVDTGFGMLTPEYTSLVLVCLGVALFVSIHVLPESIKRISVVRFPLKISVSINGVGQIWTTTEGVPAHKIHDVPPALFLGKIKIVNKGKRKVVLSLKLLINVPDASPPYNRIRAYGLDSNAISNELTNWLAGIPNKDDLLKSAVPCPIEMEIDQVIDGDLFFGVPSAMFQFAQHDGFNLGGALAHMGKNERLIIEDQISEKKIDVDFNIGVKHSAS